ncbi:hypothetical protein AXW84_13705 [Hymenobacter sp. PAMC 26628]|nr:hypothetical protein AXW84_13705 [Hymenobacter sp. PAMC 26628]
MGALAPLTPAAALARRAPHKALGLPPAAATSRGPGAIVSVPRPAAALPDLTVTGIVADEKGQGLPGTTIVLKGTTVGATTDADGEFALRIPDGTAAPTLVVSSIGYVRQEIAVGDRTTFTIKLVPNTQDLNEVVVVGYGTQKRADVTGSVASVPMDRLERLPVSNVAQALQGAVAGVNISTSSSVPGAQPSIQVRSVRSITAGTDPYIILDGVPFPGNFNDISPTDIASIKILKDASSTAIYGTRGSNGVILVTTKHGKSGKAQIRYTGYGGPEYIAHKLQLLDGAGYTAKYAAFKTQMGLTGDPVPNYGELPNYQASTETDWIKTIGQQGFIQDHNLAVSGGTDDVKYYLSGDYFKQQGVLQGYQFRRISIRSNLDANLTPWLRVGTSAFYSNSNDDAGRTDLNLAVSSSPYGLPYNPNIGALHFCPHPRPKRILGRNLG